MRTQYLQTIANGFIRKLGIKKEELFEESGAKRVSWLYERWNEDIKAMLKKEMRPETLGRIISFGKSSAHGGRGTSLFQVHRRNFLDEHADGGTLLLEIACTAIVAEIADILEHK